MSNYVTSLVYDRFPHGGSRFVVMLALADAANDAGGNLWMGYDYLAAKCRLSKRQAIRVVDSLKVDEWITEHADEYRGRTPRPDRFTIDVGKLSSCHLCVPGRGNAKVTNQAAKGDICDAKGDTISPESEAQSQIGPEPYNHITNNTARAEKAVDNSRLRALRSYLEQMEKFRENGNPELNDAEIKRVRNEIAALETERARQAQLSL